MAKPDVQGSRKWIWPAALGTTLITLGTAIVCWITAAYDWKTPLMAFSIGVAVVSWFGMIALVSVQCVKGFVHEALKYHRGKAVLETLSTLRRHEAEQWSRAIGYSNLTRSDN